MNVNPVTPLILYKSFFLAGIPILILWVVRILKFPRRHPPFPPGPSKDPLIGHIRIMPMDNQAEVFQKWTKTYGDTVYLTLPLNNRNLLILGSFETAQALLENRGAIYSCRPNFTLFELMGWTRTLSFFRYGTKKFYKHRKILSTYFGKTRKESRVRFNGMLEEDARMLVKNLLVNCEGASDGLRFVHRLTVSNMMRAAFGHRVESDDDAFVRIGNRVTHILNNCGPAGNTLVDLFPWLRRLPSWFPGTYYAEMARTTWIKDIRELHEFTFASVVERMKNKTIKQSFVSDQLEELGLGNGEKDLRDPELKEEIEDIKGAAATVFAAGEDTTYVTLCAFFLAMIRYPAVQRRAYEEIISLVGEERWPDVVTDREGLQYLECVLQEVMRWHSPVPLAVPHRSIQDDVYNGMFIPKDTVVIANIRGMTRDERVYLDPLTFNPSRYLPAPEGRGEPFPPSVWGFGRRICPGRHFADLTLWNVIASVLATLEALPPLDENGVPDIPEMVVTEGLSSGLAPFKFRARARSEKAKALVVAN